MQEYPVRTTHRSRLNAAGLLELCREAFGSGAVDGEDVVASFGAISRLAARASGRALRIDLFMDPKVPAELQAETVRRYNRFLEAATGYSAKERAKRLRKSAAAESA